MSRQEVEAGEVEASPFGRQTAGAQSQPSGSKLPFQLYLPFYSKN